MLTGDKFSTALQIATTCNLKSVNSADELFELGSSNAEDVDRQLSAYLSTASKMAPDAFYTVILRGSTLPAALSAGNTERFLELCLGSSSVICCRFSPRQKAQIVKLVKESKKMTLAIGDGGNDVSMIQEAHVGVGVRGVEGLQAARAADFQVNRFRALLPLMLVHGRQSYLRTCLVAQYSYYKSFLFCIIQILFGFANGFSGSTLFNSACVTAYNAVLFFPILTIVLDQDLPGDAIFSVPDVYRSCQRSKHFNARTYGLWMARATYQAVVIYLCTLAVYSDAFVSGSSGFPADYESIGLLAFSSYLAVQSLTLALEIRYLTFYNVAAIVGFHILTFVSLLIASSMIAFDSLIGYNSFSFVLSDPAFWFGTLLTTALAVLPVVALQYIVLTNFPSSLQVLRARLIRNGKLDAPDTDLHLSAVVPVV